MLISERLNLIGLSFVDRTFYVVHVFSYGDDDVFYVFYDILCNNISCNCNSNFFLVDVFYDLLVCTYHCGIYHNIYGDYPYIFSYITYLLVLSCYDVLQIDVLETCVIESVLGLLACIRLYKHQATYYRIVCLRYWYLLNATHATVRMYG